MPSRRKQDKPQQQQQKINDLIFEKGKQKQKIPISCHLFEFYRAFEFIYLLIAKLYNQV